MGWHKNIQCQQNLQEIEGRPDPSPRLLPPSATPPREAMGGIACMERGGQQLPAAWLIGSAWQVSHAWPGRRMRRIP